jgi:hypothetical protein
MNPEEEKQKITNSLNVAIEVLNECNAEYRIFGSALIVAYTRNIHRRIADIDILADAKSRACIVDKLFKRGFLVKSKTFGKVSITQKAEKENHTPLDILFGDFRENYFRRRVLKIGELRFRSDYVKATDYNFNGVNFIGLPLTSLIADIMLTSFKRARDLDKKVLNIETVDFKASTLIETYGVGEAYIAGIPIPRLVNLILFARNTFARIRLSKALRWFSTEKRR